MTSISLIGASSYLPEKVVDNDFFIAASGIKKHAMFRGTKLRHHIGAEESTADMMAAATDKLVERLNLDSKKSFDIILTNVTMPDLPFTGAGAVLAKKLGCQPQYIYDISNGGCVSFILMLEMARALIHTTSAKTALICNVQSSAGRIFGQEENRKQPQSAIPGDGCGVSYIVDNDESPVQSIVVHNFPEYSEDMSICTDDNRKWWEPGTLPFNVEFSDSKLANIIERGNRLVPPALYEAIDKAQLSVSDIDCLITNQPNRIFLRNWRESVELPPEKHINTFDEHGNLFGAALPISIERGLDTKVLVPGSRLLLGGFSHAGDYAAGAVIHWFPKK